MAFNMVSFCKTLLDYLSHLRRAATIAHFYKPEIYRSTSKTMAFPLNLNSFLIFSYYY